MRIGFIFYANPHIHGNRIQASILNALVEEGFDARGYSNEGVFHPKEEFNFSVFPLTAIENEDILIGCDMGVNLAQYYAFMEAKAALKIWYFLNINIDYVQVMLQKEVIKVACSSFAQREIQKLCGSEVFKIMIPADTVNFFPIKESEVPRSNYILYYAKKASWVAPLALDYAYEKNNQIVAGIFGESNPKEDPEKCPKIRLKASSDRKDYVNFIYNSARLSICSDGESESGPGPSGFIIESMSAGTPLICSDWEGFADIIIPNETAFTIKHGKAPETRGAYWMVRPHPVELSEAILSLYDDAETQKRLSTNALELIRQYDSKYWVRELKKLL